MNKIIKAFTGVLLTLSVIAVAACNSVTEEVKTLQMYVPGVEQNNMKKIINEVNKITRSKIGVDVNVHFVNDNSYAQVLKNVIDSREACDVFFVGYNNPYAKMIENGYLYPLKDLLNTEAPELKSTLPQYLLDAVDYKNEIYAVPNQQIELTQYAFYAKKEVADKYDIDKHPIKDMADFEKYLEWVKNNYPDLIPVSETRIEFEFEANNEFKCANIPIGKFVIIKDESSNITVKDESELKSYYQFAKRSENWYKKGYLRKDIESIINNNYDILNGIYATICDFCKPGYEGEFYSRNGYEVKAIYKTKAYMNNANLLTTMLGVNAYSEEPVKAIKLIELLNTDKKLYNLLCYGIEGEDYEITEDGKARILNKMGYPQLRPWIFGNEFNSLILEGQDDDVWEKTKKMNDDAEKSPFIGFFCEDISEKYRDSIAEIEAVGNRWYSRAYKGNVDVDSWYNEYVRQMKMTGVDEVKKVLQERVDSYIKDKMK